MGSGEPLDNYDEVLKFLKNVSAPDGVNISARNISLSTCGLVPKIYVLNLVKSYKVDVARLAFKKRKQTVGVFFVAVFRKKRRRPHSLRRYGRHFRRADNVRRTDG